MERIRKIASLFLLVLICCVTVFQCHHHDAAGHAFFLAYGDEEITSGLQHGDCHSHDCGVPRDDGTSDCGMHLADAMTIGKSGHSFCSDVLFACVISDCPFDFSVEESSCGNTCKIIRDLGSVTVGYGHINLLRGPPCALELV